MLSKTRAKIVVSAGHNHLGIINQERYLRMTGDNSVGQLGIGSYSDPNNSTLESVLSSYQLKDISCGVGITGAVTVEGEVYVWGNNIKGQLGIGTNNPKDINLPTKVNLPEIVDKIRCGDDSIIILTETGKVFAWGSVSKSCNLSGGVRSLVPVKINLPSKVIDIAVNNCRMAAVTEDGKLYLWGDHKNQLCYQHRNFNLSLRKYHDLQNFTTELQEKILTPNHIVIPEKVFSVSLGYDHLGVISESGIIYLLGNNQKGQLNDVKTMDSDTHFEKIQFSSPISKLELGNFISAAITQEGLLYVWGDYSPGKKIIGRMISTSASQHPVKINIKSNVTDLSVGYHYILVVCDNEDIYLWKTN
jgi:alpha-tubulin suppressor-like RCC1 family protein